jgi:hypothetical protein
MLLQSLRQRRNLEIQFQRELPDTRRPGLSYLAECARILYQRGCVIRNQTAGRQELGVVENVEKFGTELQVEPLGDRGVLQQREIEVVDARAMEEPAASVTFDAERGSRKGCGAEILTVVSPGVGDVDRPDLIRRIDRQRNGAAERGAEKRTVVGLHDRYGEAGGKTGDSTDGPTVGQALRAFDLIEGQLVGVAGDKVVGRIKGGQTPAGSRIDRIDLFAVAGRISE